MVNSSTNINKTKESLNSDGQQFNQYQQNKRKFLSFVLLILVELLTIFLPFFIFVYIG
jgi:hypothetical protein